MESNIGLQIIILFSNLTYEHSKLNSIALAHALDMLKALTNWNLNRTSLNGASGYELHPIGVNQANRLNMAEKASCRTHIQTITVKFN